MALVLRGGHVWDGEAQEPHPLDLVCNHGVIERLEAPGQILPAAEDTVIDLNGSIVLPGLIDDHVHLVWDSSRDPAERVEHNGEQVTVLSAAEHARQHLRAGITTVADLGSNWDIAISLSQGVEAGILQGPTILAAGRTVVMTGGHDPFWGNMCDGPNAVTRGVRQQAFRGASIIKTAATGGVYGRSSGEEVGASELNLEELAALTTEAHRRGLRVTAHALGAEGIHNAVLAGVDIIQHGVFLTDETVDLMTQKGTALSPTLAVYRRIADGSAPAYAAAKAKEVVQAHQRSLSKAIDAGIPILAGTDAGSPGMPHPSLGDELAALHEFGMPPVDVLKAATSRSARALGIASGQIREGSPADLISVDGDPFSDPRAALESRVVIHRQRVIKDQSSNSAHQ